MYIRMMTAIASLTLISACSEGGNDQAPPSEEAATAPTEAVSADTQGEIPQFTSTGIPPELAKSATDTFLLQSTQADILGVRLGMSPEAVTERLRRKGFNIASSAELPERHDGYEIPLLRGIGYAHVTPGVTDEVVTWYTLEEQPRLQAIYRGTTYEESAAPNFQEFMAGLRKKYGEPDESNISVNTSSSFEWHDPNDEDCAYSNVSLSFIRRANDVFWARCFRGVYVDVTLNESFGPNAVMNTMTYITDTKLAEANYLAVKKYLMAQRSKSKNNPTRQAPVEF